MGALALVALPLAAVPKPGTLLSAVLYVTAVASSFIFFSLMIGRIPPERRGGWRLLQVSTGVSLVAELLFKTSQYRNATEYPTPGDVFYVLSYLPLVVGLLRLDRQRGGRFRLGDQLDSLIVTTSAAALALVFLVLPAARDDELTLAAQVVASLYPLIDVLVVFLAVRLLVGGRRGQRPTVTVWLLIAGLGSLLAGDVAQHVMAASSESVLFPRWINTLWLASYLFTALAGWRAGRERPGRVGGQDVRMTWLRLVLMTAAAGVPPMLVVFQAGRDGRDQQVALGVATTVLLGLVMLRFWDLHRQLDRRTQALGIQATTDALTGLPNRRAWDVELPVSFERSRSVGTALLVAVIDVDHFKRYNDSYGHAAGDDLLREAALAWQGRVGAAGMVARWGGEEFVALVHCPETAAGLERLDALRALVPHGQTCSIGVARWDGTEDGPALVRRADEALYQAKRQGRDRLVLQQTVIPHARRPLDPSVTARSHA